MTDMGTVEYLLKLYSRYFTLRWEGYDLSREPTYAEGYKNGYYDGYYAGIADNIESTALE